MQPLRRRRRRRAGRIDVGVSRRSRERRQLLCAVSVPFVHACAQRSHPRAPRVAASRDILFFGLLGFSTKKIRFGFGNFRPTLGASLLEPRFPSELVVDVVDETQIPHTPPPVAPARTLALIPSRFQRRIVAKSRFSTPSPPRPAPLAARLARRRPPPPPSPPRRTPPRRRLRTPTATATSTTRTTSSSTPTPPPVVVVVEIQRARDAALRAVPSLASRRPRLRPSRAPPSPARAVQIPRLDRQRANPSSSPSPRHSRNRVPRRVARRAPRARSPSRRVPSFAPSRRAARRPSPSRRRSSAPNLSLTVHPARAATSRAASRARRRAAPRVRTVASFECRPTDRRIPPDRANTHAPPTHRAYVETPYRAPLRAKSQKEAKRSRAIFFARLDPPRRRVATRRTIPRVGRPRQPRIFRRRDARHRTATTRRRRPTPPRRRDATRRRERATRDEGRRATRDDARRAIRRRRDDRGE